MITPFAIVALLATAVVGQNFTINTPSNAVQCEPTLITWVGGTPPYFISVQPGDNPGGNALETFPQQTGTSYTWTVNIAAGTSIGLLLRDSQGNTKQSAAFPVQAGGPSSCLGTQTGTLSSTSAPGSTSAIVGGSSSSSVTSSVSTSSQSAASLLSSSSTRSSTSSAPTSTPTGGNSGAGSLVAPAGVAAGVVAFVAAML